MKMTITQPQMIELSTIMAKGLMYTVGVRASVEVMTDTEHLTIAFTVFEGEIGDVYVLRIHDFDDYEDALIISKYALEVLRGDIPFLEGKMISRMNREAAIQRMGKTLEKGTV